MILKRIDMNKTMMRTSRLWCRAYATEPPTPPMLAKIRQDLKLAMQNKDTARLAVLKNLLTKVTNSMKSARPVRTDSHLLNIIYKTIKESKIASEQFQKNGRQDLVDNEESQLKVLKEYSDLVNVISEDEIKNSINSIIENLEQNKEDIKMGTIIKKLYSPDYFGDKPVIKELVILQVEKAQREHRNKNSTTPQPEL